MSVSTLESENAQPVAQTQNSELIYRLEDRPPLPQTLFAACQHLLAMFVAVITPALLICQALGYLSTFSCHYYFSTFCWCFCSYIYHSYYHPVYIFIGTTLSTISI